MSSCANRDLTSAKVRKVFETAKFQLLQNIVKK